MRINLLGFTSSFASLVLETIAVRHPGAEVTIIENIPRRDDDPFLPRGVSVTFAQLDALTAKPMGQCVLSLGKPDGKWAVWNLFKDRLGLGSEDLLTLVSPHAVVATTATIGPGTYVEPGVVISPFAVLEEMVTVNRSSSIGHHARLRSFSTVNPGCHIAGHVDIGHRSQIGIGSSIFGPVSIGDRTLIGGGSVVTKDIPSDSMAMGSPCRVTKQRSH
jgi:sugar O-acyltransferase (sialic acid O-acetyltransferase NeuD family)